MKVILKFMAENGRDNEQVLEFVLEKRIIFDKNLSQKPVEHLYARLQTRATFLCPTMGALNLILLCEN